MPSLNQRRHATDLLREAARARLEREAATRAQAAMASEKPVLRLFTATAPVGKGWADDGTHKAWRHVRVFIQNNPVKSLTSKRVRIVGAVECDAGGSGIYSADFDVQFRFVRRLGEDGTGELF